MVNEIEYDPDNDCYAILGVYPGVDRVELKKRYKKLVLKLHPDKHPLGARKYFHVPFTRMQNAYDILQDHSEEAMYYTNRKQHYIDMFPFETKRNDMCEYLCELSSKHKDKIDTETKKIDALISISEKWKQEEKKRRDTQRAQEKEIQAEKRRQEEEEAKRQKRKREEQAKEREKRAAEDEAEDNAELKAKLKAELKEVQREFEIWERLQKAKRAKEVENRESELRLLDEKRDKAIQELNEALNDTIENLRNEFRRKTQKREEQHEREVQNKKAFHETERETQKIDRKRVRDSYRSWDNEMRSIVEGDGPPPAKAPKRPDFYKPCFGRKKNGTYCRFCRKAGGFCSMHADQKW